MTEQNNIHQHGELAPLLEPSDPRPYSITDTHHLEKPIDGCTWAFGIVGPGWPPNRMFAGTQERCGQDFVDGLNMAYKWGVRAGKLAAPPFGGL